MRRAPLHATAKVDVPVKQAHYGIIEVFFDTFVICTFTALIIMVSGVWNSGVTDGTVLAAKLERGEISKEEYDRWRYKYPELDQSGRWSKVPSQALSDTLIEELKKE